MSLFFLWFRANELVRWSPSVEWPNCFDGSVSLAIRCDVHMGLFWTFLQLAFFNASCLQSHFFSHSWGRHAGFGYWRLVEEVEVLQWSQSFLFAGGMSQNGLSFCLFFPKIFVPIEVGGLARRSASSDRGNNSCLVRRAGHARYFGAKLAIASKSYWCSNYRLWHAYTL